MPGELDEHRLETLKFIKDVGLDWAGFSLAYPSKGSILYDLCIENGYIAKQSFLNGTSQSEYIIDNPDYPREHIIEQTYTMNLDVNFVHNRRMQDGQYEVAAKAFKQVLDRYSEHAFAYFYLAKAIGLSKGKTDEALFARERYLEIIRSSERWQKYNDHFSLDVSEIDGCFKA